VEQEKLIFDDRVVEGTGQPRDPIASALPMAAIPSASKNPSVSGSKERQLPIDVTVSDLTAPANLHPLSDDRDQVGVRSVATVLYHWVNWWRIQIYSSPIEPPRDVEGLMAWIAPRLSAAIMDKDFDIAYFAEDLISLRGQLRNALGDRDLKPVVMWGIPCRRCNTVSTLVMNQEDPDQWRECKASGCGLLMTDQEYKDWLVETLGKMKSRSTQVAQGDQV
jgi:hypothetical protein